MIFLSRNKVVYSIGIFICLYSLVVFAKPSFLFYNDGSLREFGLNSTQNTIISGWVLSIFLAFVSYLIVMYSSIFFTPSFDLYSH